MVSPILEEIAEEYSDKPLTIAKLNIEDNPVTASKYNIRSIPTLILLKDNEIIINRVGSFSKGQLKELLNNNLS
jgi:thioredoxin 1